MGKYFCRSCSYKFMTKGEKLPRGCPACGSNDIKEDYDAETLLREVIGEDPF